MNFSYSLKSQIMFHKRAEVKFLSESNSYNRKFYHTNDQRTRTNRVTNNVMHIYSAAELYKSSTESNLVRDRIIVTKKREENELKMTEGLNYN